MAEQLERVERREIERLIIEMPLLASKSYPAWAIKQTRAEPFAVQVNNHNVEMIVGDWNATYKEELRSFPNGKWDDQVDASSRAHMVRQSSRNESIQRCWRCERLTRVAEGVYDPETGWRVPRSGCSSAAARAKGTASMKAAAQQFGENAEWTSTPPTCSVRRCISSPRPWAAPLTLCAETNATIPASIAVGAYLQLSDGHRMARLPTADEAELIRRYVGVTKRPDLSAERIAALK